MNDIAKQLKNVQEAIEAIELRGQSYSIEVNGIRRTLTRADLPALYKRESRLLIQMKRMNGSVHYPRF